MISIEGIIANHDDLFRGRIEIDTETGLITKVGEATGSADVVLKEEIIFPGFIDLHVHAREDAGHTQEYKEDFITAGLAARHGGVVAFADMPNNIVPPVDDTSYAAKDVLAQAAAAKTDVTILLYAGIGPMTTPLSKKVPYKVFMSHSVGDLFFSSHKELETALEKYRGQSVSFHCEDPKILEQSKLEKHTKTVVPPKPKFPPWILLSH